MSDGDDDTDDDDNGGDDWGDIALHGVILDAIDRDDGR